MTAAGYCSECQRTTDRYVVSMGWLCEKCDPLADLIERRQAKQSGSKAEEDDSDG